MATIPARYELFAHLVAKLQIAHHLHRCRTFLIALVALLTMFFFYKFYPPPPLKYMLHWTLGSPLQAPMFGMLKVHWTNPSMCVCVR